MFYGSNSSGNGIRATGIILMSCAIPCLNFVLCVSKRVLVTHDINNCTLAFNCVIKFRVSPDTTLICLLFFCQYCLNYTSDFLTFTIVTRDLVWQKVNNLYRNTFSLMLTTLLNIYSSLKHGKKSMLPIF